MVDVADDVVRVVDDCCSPWHMYRMSSAAAPAAPPPQNIAPFSNPQENDCGTATVALTFWPEASVLFLAAPKHVVWSLTSS